MPYAIVRQTPRKEVVTEYATVDDAESQFSAIEPRIRERYLLVDPDGDIIDSKPEIPESIRFRSTVRRASNQYAVYISIPATVRDELMLNPGDELTVEIHRP